ncbi:oligosaccharide flippase family protein [Nocardioides nitrophenolicus]|uniref:oligosaccharide flippase family protein n=1 Tax=Nocardioides nitrophenolicus TaxID=60489 RepID=UPI00195CB6D4|nr:oligosaccharide flippase family protein [Nocardioides nitrophenolicus]MBM7520313.1 O-antigen/teichoic acid export membrane protein [Nocardioides nitrophenolicus]
MTAAVTTGPPRVSPPPVSPVAGSGWLGLGAVAAKTCQTAVLLVFAAVLAPDEFGIISLAAVLLNVCVVLADLGTSTALVPFRGDAERAARSALSLALALSAAIVAVVWLAAPWLAVQLRIGAEGAGVLRGIVLCLPLAAAAGVSAELLRRSLDFRRRVLPDIGGNLVGALVTVAALAAGQGAFALVTGQLVQAALVQLLFWALRRPVLPGWSRGDVRALLAFGGGWAGSSLLTLLILNLDFLLVAHRLGAHDVGTYSMAFRLAYMPYLLIAMVIGGSLFAHLSRMRAAAVGRAAVDAALLVHALVVPLYVGLLVLAPGLTLLGEQWAPAVPALRWLAAYGLVLSALEVLVVVLKAAGRTTDVLALTGLHLVLLLVLLLLVVDRGITAVAAAQLGAVVLTVVAAGVLVAHRVPSISWPELGRGLLPVAAGGGALGLTALAVGGLLPVARSSLVGVLAAGGAASVAYLTTVVLLDRAGRTGLGRVLRPGRWAAPSAMIAGLTAAALATAALAVLAPVPVLVTLAGGAVVAAALARLEWAAVLLVVAEPFGDLLREAHPEAVKAVGLLLFASWLLRLVAGAGPSVTRHPAGGALGVIVLALLASSVLRGMDLAVGLDHAVSYASYALVVAALVDAVRRGRPGAEAVARRLATCFFLACTAAAVVATLRFLSTGGRAAGPLEDPNDLAFFLVAALPFGFVVAHRRSPLATAGVLACAAALVVATCATFSRGALLALVVMLLAALALRTLRLTTVVGLGLAASAALGLLWASHADLVERSIAEKEHIAAANVDSRYTTWTMAAEMTADSPLLGQGPGGFAAATPAFVPGDVAAVPQTVVHNMYLDVASELGLLGLVAFLALLGYAARGAARARRVPERRVVADAVLLGFAGTLTAACFLSEQFYLPVWLLVALGVALDPGPVASERRV